MMTFQECFPVWNKLNATQQERLLSSLTTRNIKKALSCMMEAKIAQDCF